MEWLKLNDDTGEVSLVAEEVKLVPELQLITTLTYNKGPKDHEGRKKYRAKSELKYLYLAYSLKSPYRDFSEPERILEAKKDCGLPEEWRESSELKALVVRYKASTPGKVNRLLNTVAKFMDKFETYLNKIDLDERNASGGLVYKATDVMATLERLPRLAETLQELENQAKLGVIAKVTSKGDHEIGWMNKDNKIKNGGTNTGYTEEDQG